MKTTVIKFCKNKCCPVIEVTGNDVILGDANGPEGITKWNKEQFRFFVDAAKNGDFDLV